MSGGNRRTSINTGSLLPHTAAIDCTVPDIYFSRSRSDFALGLGNSNIGRTLVRETGDRCATASISPGLARRIGKYSAESIAATSSEVPESWPEPACNRLT